MKLRHVPLLLVREMARYATHRSLVAATLAAVIQRADELTEFVAIYWAEGRVPLSAQSKRGLPPRSRSSMSTRSPSTTEHVPSGCATSSFYVTPSLWMRRRPRYGSA